MNALRYTTILLLVSAMGVGCGESDDDKCIDADSRLRECTDYLDGLDELEECHSDLEACIADCILNEPEGECEDIRALYDDGNPAGEFGRCSIDCDRAY